MRKIYFYLLFAVVCTIELTKSAFCQLDSEHYLPPLKQRINGTVQLNANKVYLSTPVTSSFIIDVYKGSNTTPITQITLSKASPATYDPGTPNNDITVVSDANTGSVLSTAGLKFKSRNGEKFFVNLRISSVPHASSLTAKGRAALGTLHALCRLFFFCRHARNWLCESRVVNGTKVYCEISRID